MTTICELSGVREYVEGEPVELYRDAAGRVVLLAVNEGGHNSTHIDFGDLLRWIASEEGRAAIAEHMPGSK